MNTYAFPKVSFYYSIIYEYMIDNKININKQKDCLVPFRMSSLSFYLSGFRLVICDI